MRSSDFEHLARCAAKRAALHFLADDGPYGRSYRESQTFLSNMDRANYIKYDELVGELRTARLG